MQIIVPPLVASDVIVTCNLPHQLKVAEARFPAGYGAGMDCRMLRPVACTGSDGVGMGRMRGQTSSVAHTAGAVIRCTCTRPQQGQHKPSDHWRRSPPSWPRLWPVGQIGSARALLAKTETYHAPEPLTYPVAPVIGAISALIAIGVMLLHSRV
jgi:hypothetical protein